MILVTGATGLQGGAVARRLLERGHRVRALTRDPGKGGAKALAELGAEVVAGDFEDPDSLRRAAGGTSAVFAMGTPFEISPEAEERQGLALVEAVHEAGTGHIVYSSVASALDGTGIPHFESKAAVERRLAELGTRWSVIAPAAFLDNVHASWIAPILAQGIYAFPLPGDVPLQQVAISDVADFAVLVIEQPERFAGRRVELASVSVTGPDFAAVLGKHLGREIRFQEAPLDGADDDLEAMIRFFRNGGYTVDIPALHASYPEIAWRSLDSWAAEQDWSALQPVNG
jgi:uncharacterized protein YbjT (DUF2867 family)